MPSTVYFDFETRSTCDIRKVGADVYARHPDTEILCCAMAFDEEKPRLITEQKDWNIGGDLNAAIFWDTHTNMLEAKFVAHNAPFDILIWNHVATKQWGWPYLDPKKVHCTMAQCYSMSLPGSLDESTEVLGLSNKKDMKAKRVMLQLSKPRAKPHGVVKWWTKEEFPEKYDILYKYCLKDIEAMRGLHEALPKLNDRERRIWELDYKINQRGVGLDIDAVVAAKKFVAAEKKRLDGKIKELSKGEIATCGSVMQIVKWLHKKGFEINSIGKQDLVNVLRNSKLTPEVRAVLETRQESAKSSTAKLEAMLSRLCGDKKMRGLFQYHGALTGRWAGRGVQLQNLPRPSLNGTEIDNVFRLLKRGESHDSIESIFE